MNKKFISPEQILKELKNIIEKREGFYLNYDKNEEQDLITRAKNLIKKMGNKNDFVRKFSSFYEALIGKISLNYKKPIMTTYKETDSNLRSDTGIILLEVFFKILKPTENESIEKFNCALIDLKYTTSYDDVLKKLLKHITLIYL